MKKVIKFGCLVSLCLFVYIFIASILFDGNICLFKILFGFPCPSCGMTRAFQELIQFHFVKAFQLHPLIYLVPFLFLFILLIIKHPKKLVFKFFLSFILLLFFVVYIVRMRTIFPAPPLELYENSVFHRIFHIF